MTVPTTTPAQTHRTTTRRVILIAHGSPDPRHGAGVRRLADRMAQCSGEPVVASFLEHDFPSATDVLTSPAAADRTTVVPLLLTAGFHWRSDIPPIVAHEGRSVRLVAPPPPVAFVETIADMCRGTADVVLASAGSSRPEIGPRFEMLADQLRRQHGFRRVPVALSVGAVADVARPGALVVPVLTADGVFADRIRQAAASAGATHTDVLGDVAGFAAVLSDLAAD